MLVTLYKGKQKIIVEPGTASEAHFLDKGYSQDAPSNDAPKAETRRKPGRPKKSVDDNGDDDSADAG